MTEHDIHDIEEKVKNAFTSNVPDVLDSILSHCDKQDGRTIAVEQTKSRNNVLKWAAGIAAALVLVLAGAFGANLYQTNYTVASTVSLDVNPSIEIKTNQKEKVLEVNPLNEDGKIVIGDMSLEGSSLDVTVNALIGSILRNGYLNDMSNSILISVSGNNNESALALQEKLTAEINSMLNTDEFSGAVISQTISPDEELQALADAYGISLGKARLVKQVSEQQPDYSFEDLSELTINQLNLMSEVNGIELEETQVVGNASDKAYIGIDRAKEIALANAGTASENDVAKLEIEMDFEHGIMIYEVSFFYNNYKYNYDIDAVTGEITEAKSNPVENKENTTDKTDDNKTDSSNNSGNNSNNNNGSTDSPAQSTSYIGAEKAKEIAFAHAGVASESDVSKLEVDTDDDHNVLYYEIEFDYNDCEYEYKIDAATGTITEFDCEPLNSGNKGNSGSKGDSKSDGSDKKDDKKPEDNTDYIANTNFGISADSAKEIALSRSGISESSLISYECVPYVHKELPMYKIILVTSGKKCVCAINGNTGEIVEYEEHPQHN